MPTMRQRPIAEARVSRSASARGRRFRGKPGPLARGFSAEAPPGQRGERGYVSKIDQRAAVQPTKAKFGR
ncbi:Hypp4142 [Branchiostoma lanceolatum]|uniref:Hypp4142 protein n=1 Tax=Branchiostoma lanceolatum TaxID=7740 RepID=A0A8K0EZV7_BRALA|nr:Hypp4142 [Branchiostoma lanceolatum]